MKWLSVWIPVLAMATGCRGWESEQPPVHLIPNMDTQDKGKAYRRDKSGLFADGRQARLPIEGTVAQGQLGEDTVFEDGIGADGQPTLTYPAGVKEKLNDEFRAKGKSRYLSYCAPCHGVNADGKGTVNTDKGLLVAPPSFYDARLKEMPVGKIYSAIKNGVNNGNMGSYAAQIVVEDRWAVVAYIRQLQIAADPKVVEQGGANLVVAAATASSAEHGGQLYKAKGCNACHSLDGSRLVGPSFKGLYGRTAETSAGKVTSDKAYIVESIKAPNAKIVNSYPPAMPMIALTDIEIDSLVKFIEQQK